MRNFKRMRFDELEASDLGLLIKAAETSRFGYKAAHLLEWIAHDKMQCWKGKGEGYHFLFLTMVNKHPGGNELEIWSLAGKGYVEKVPQIYEALKTFAKENECQWLTGFENRKAFSRIYKVVEPVTRYRYWIKEFDHV